jgi:hypothetical protein
MSDMLNSKTKQKEYNKLSPVAGLVTWTPFCDIPELKLIYQFGEAEKK